MSSLLPTPFAYSDMLRKLWQGMSPPTHGYAKQGHHRILLNSSALSPLKEASCHSWGASPEIQPIRKGLKAKTTVYAGRVGSSIFVLQPLFVCLAWLGWNNDRVGIRCTWYKTLVTTFGAITVHTIGCCNFVVPDISRRSGLRMGSVTDQS